MFFETVVRLPEALDRVEQVLDLQHDAGVLVFVCRKDFRDILELVLEHIAALHRLVPLQPPLLIFRPVIRPDGIGCPHVDADVLAEREHPGPLLLDKPEVEVFLLLADLCRQFLALFFIDHIGSHGLDVLVKALLTVAKGRHQLGGDPLPDVVDHVLSAKR